MSRINTNIASLIAHTYLQRSQKELDTVLEHLSTGLKINRGSDDPAGMTVSESLRTDMAGIEQAIANSQRASNVIATTEGALNEIAAMLVSMEDLAVEAANEGAMSDEEIAANQLQIDSAVEAITRIANTTVFAGKHVLDGSLAYVTSGLADSAISDLELYSVQFASSEYVPVTVQGLSAAQKAAVEFQTSQVASSMTLQVRGLEGVTTFSFASGTAASAIAAAINAVSDEIGVEAAYINASAVTSGIRIRSLEYGSKAFVSVQAIEGGASFAVCNDDGDVVTHDEGLDARVTINGGVAVGDGLHVSLRSADLDVEMLLDEDFGTNSTSFAITGGGAKYQVGPTIDSTQQVNIGVRSTASSALGNASTGYLSQIASGEDYSLVGGNAAQASEIIEEAIKQVAVLRGRLGAFERQVLDTNVSSLEVTLENIAASESQIRDADFAYETSQLARAQILTQAGTAVLSIANQTPQAVLALFGI